MNTPTKAVLVIATLDTKGEEAAYLRRQISARGHTALVMDVGTFRSSLFVGDIGREEVAEAAGEDIQSLVEKHDEADAISAMARGASRIVGRLVAEGKLAGLIAIGGSMGTYLGLTVMQSVPIGIPKMMVSTIACTPLLSSELACGDLLMLQTIGDLDGRDPLADLILDRAASAIVGMTSASDGHFAGSRPMVAVTTLGSAAHEYVGYCKKELVQRGYQPVVFHSVGTGTCEQLIRAGYFTGVLNLSLFEIVSLVCGGALRGSDGTLVASCKTGLPQVLAPGAIDWFDWPGTLGSIPSEYSDRAIRMHNPTVCQIRTTVEEKVKVAEIVADRLQKAVAPATVLIPMGGFSSLDDDGMLFCDREGREAFANALESKLVGTRTKVMRLDIHINDPLFARCAVTALETELAGE